MKIILITIGNFQEYIIDNIKNLLLYQNNDITIITEKYYFIHFKDFPSLVLIDCKDLDDYQFNNNSLLDKNGRGGFWHFASLRLFYLYSYIKKYNLINSIHLENDTLFYENTNNLIFKENKVYATFDCDNRVIPGIIFIPNYQSFEGIIMNYKNNLNDMENMALCKNIIEPLPIFPIINNIDIINKNYNDFKVIFDGAAIGQYLGGIDPRNTTEPDTRGFVNETCVIKYNFFKFIWKKNNNNLYQPYIIINDIPIRIINLHIHSKQLYNFLSDLPLETKYISIID